MELYHLTSKAGRKAALADNTTRNQPQIAVIAVHTLLFFIISFSGCSGSDESSGNSSEFLSGDTSNTSYYASSLDMKWGSAPFHGFNPITISLYEDEIPNSIDSDIEETISGEDTSLIYYNVSVPTLTAYLPPPDSATGVAVIYCPGGGYSQSQYGSGIIIARELNKHGITCFILKYRLPSDSIMEDKSIGPIQDAQQAIKIVREGAEQWRIDPAKIGIMGYSAGGHLASTAGTHFDVSYIPNEENTDLRPDFMILASSVISMDKELTHQGTRDSLLGEDPEEDLVKLFSNELQITKDTPPSWLIHAEDDTIVPVENSVRFYEGSIEDSILSVLDLYSAGYHCLLWNLSADEWMQDLLEWMSMIGIMTSEQAGLQESGQTSSM